jgi:hypothetical protein
MFYADNFSTNARIDRFRERAAWRLTEARADLSNAKTRRRVGLSSSPGNWWPGVGDLVKTVSTLVAELSAHPTC